MSGVDPQKMVEQYDFMEKSPGGMELKRLGFHAAWERGVPGGWHWRLGEWYLCRWDFGDLGWLGMILGGRDGHHVLWWSESELPDQGSLDEAIAAILGPLT